LKGRRTGTRQHAGFHAAEQRDREFADSPLEESGFEPLVPLTLNQANAGEREEKIAMSPLRRIG
jgi:hypothetical protein